MDVGFCLRTHLFSQRINIIIVIPRRDQEAISCTWKVCKSVDRVCRGGNGWSAGCQLHPSRCNRNLPNYTLIHCDSLFVMDAENLVEEWNFEQLMERKGLFYNLSSRQISQKLYRKLLSVGWNKNQRYPEFSRYRWSYFCAVCDSCVMSEDS